MSRASCNGFDGQLPLVLNVILDYEVLRSSFFCACGMPNELCPKMDILTCGMNLPTHIALLTVTIRFHSSYVHPRGYARPNQRGGTDKKNLCRERAPTVFVCTFEQQNPPSALSTIYTCFPPPQMPRGTWGQESLLEL